MASFQENLRREVKSPNNWDLASAGATTLDGFFKKFAERQLLAAEGRLASASDALAMARDYEVHANAMAKIRDRLAPAGSIVSANDAALLQELTAQESIHRSAASRLRESSTSGLAIAALRSQAAQIAMGAGKALGRFVALGQLVDAASTGSGDEVGKVTAGIFAGAIGTYLGGAGGAAGLVTLGALFGVVVSAPAVTVVALFAAVTLGYFAGKGGEAAWLTWVSSPADKKIREMVGQAEAM